MSLNGEADLRKGNKLCRWFDFPLSPKNVKKVRKIYADSRSREDWSPPLIFATYLGLEYVVKAFIHCAIETNTNLHTDEGDAQKFLWMCNIYGQTAFDTAIDNNHVDLAKLLLKNASLECLISKRNYRGYLPVSMLSFPEHDDFIFNILEDAKRKEADPPIFTTVHDHPQQGSWVYAHKAMNPHSYPVSRENNIQESLVKLNSYELELTPNKNTILHLVSQCGDVKCVKDILVNHSSLLYLRNVEGETPAYVAAREGHIDILAIMINHFKRNNDIIEPLVTRDVDKHTALHIAIENHHVGVIFWLVTEIPQLVNCINDLSEIPHYLAAERGFHYIFNFTFRNCNQRHFARPDGKTTLHAAAISGSADCIRTVVNYSKDLLSKEDESGWKPLLYTISHNYSSATAALLDADCSIGYQLLRKDDITTLPIHIAASYGHCETMGVLISKCPGCLETTYVNGRNILHFAIENKRIEVIKFIFRNELFTSLINKKNSDGDTPIHLFMASDLEMMEVITDSRVNIHALNNKYQTPFDVASSHEKGLRVLKGLANVRGRDNPTRVLFPEVNRPSWSNEETPEMLQQKEREKELKERQKEYEPYFKMVDNLVLVCTLIATASFAAGFTVPGGFDGNAGSKQGMPVLLGKAAYKAFVVTNTIAFSCSSSVLLGYIWLLIYRVSYDEVDEEELEGVPKRVLAMYILTGVAMLTMAIAFVTGIYVVLTASLDLAILLCVMSVCIMVIMSVFPEQALEFLVTQFSLIISAYLKIKSMIVTAPNAPAGNNI